MKHADRDLAAYSEGLLPEIAAIRVRGHLAECEECRVKLSHHEDLMRELRFSLAFNTIPRERQIADWWQNLATPRNSDIRPRVYVSMLPALLTVLVVILPFSLAIAGHSRAFTAPISVTMSSPAVNTTISAPDSVKLAVRVLTDTTSQPRDFLSATPEGASGTPVPVIPAPLAP
jgi:hypothetical protein